MPTATSRAMLLVAALAASLLVSVSAPATAAPTEPFLNVRAQGKQAGEFSARVSVGVRCSGGAIVQDLHVDAVQGDIRGSGSGGEDVVCDGVHRVVEVVLASNGPPFEVGPADVHAELLLLDPVHQDPLPLVTHDRVVQLLAPLQARVADHLTLAPDGSLTAVVEVRCQVPWVEADFGVEVSQRRGRVAASSYGHSPTCDGAWHQLVLTFVGEKPFTAVLTSVLLSGHVLDPEHFDPVGGIYRVVHRPVVAG